MRKIIKMFLIAFVKTFSRRPGPILRSQSSAYEKLFTLNFYKRFINKNYLLLFERKLALF